MDYQSSSIKNRGVRRQTVLPILPILLAPVNQEKPQSNILLRPANDLLLHERCKQRWVKLQALLLSGQHAHEQRKKDTHINLYEIRDEQNTRYQGSRRQARATERDMTKGHIDRMESGGTEQQDQAERRMDFLAL